MQIVLLGAGHAHVEVVRRLARRPIAGAQVTLVTREKQTPYSGMLPGVIRRDYSAAQAHVECSTLARASGVRLIVAAAQAIDPPGGRILLAGNRAVPFDLLSVDVGGELPMPPGSGVAVKPIGRFLARLDDVERRLPSHAPIAVVGNGPAGVELALALAWRLDGPARPHIVLIGHDAEPLAATPARARRIARAALVRAGVQIISGVDVVGQTDGAVILAGGARVPAAAAFWAIGVTAPRFIATSGLAVDAAGCIRVDATLRSLSDRRVFAAGDCAAFDPPLPKAGVWAVRAGPMLECNLRRAADGQQPLPWRPQSRALAILGLGGGRALAWRGRWVFGGLGLDGHVAWWWKDWLDRRWVRRYRSG